MVCQGEEVGGVVVGRGVLAGVQASFGIDIGQDVVHGSLRLQLEGLP